MNALDAALCAAVKLEAQRAGLEGNVWGRVVLKNPSAVQDVHSARIEAAIAKKWRALMVYPVSVGFDLESTINRFAKDFVEFYEQAQAA